MTPRVIGPTGFREAVQRAYHDALAALDPRRLAREAVTDPGRPVRVFGVGKASVAMARGVLDALGERVAGGLVVTTRHQSIEGLEVLEAGHPHPDARSELGGRELLGAVTALGPDELGVCVISGGASALAAVPAPGITLADKAAAARALMAAGASIGELNTVRKHLSAIKGGRLAAASGGPLVALVLSDVVGNDLSTIGSGLLWPDPTTVADAQAIGRKFGVALPPLHESPKRLPPIETRLLAGPEDLARAAGGTVVDGAVTCTVEELAERLLAHAEKPGTWVFAGEPTIALPPKPGRGGRAQQTALLVARRLRGDAVVLCAASDGADGPTNDAGAIVDSGTAARITAAGIDVDRAVAACDAGTALAACGDLLTTGPTGTNLTDLYVVMA